MDWLATIGGFVVIFLSASGLVFWFMFWFGVNKDRKVRANKIASREPLSSVGEWGNWACGNRECLAFGVVYSMAGRVPQCPSCGNVMIDAPTYLPKISEDVLEIKRMVAGHVIPDNVLGKWIEIARDATIEPLKALSMLVTGMEAWKTRRTP